MRLARPGNAALAAAGTGVGILMATTCPPARAWLAPLATLLVTGLGNVLNDLGDRDIDRRAHPKRPLPSGAVTVSHARTLAILLGVGGVAAALAAGGPWLAVAAVAVVATLAAYEWRLKAQGLPGNLAVAALVGATFPFGALAATTAASWSPLHGVSMTTAGAVPWDAVLRLAGLAFLANVARELWKDLEDAAADRATRRTSARHGARAVHVLAVPAVVAAVLLSLPLLGDGRLWLLAVADALFLAALPIGLRNPGAGQRWLKAAMAVALVAFAVAHLPTRCG